MSTLQIVEILAEHADQMNRGEKIKTDSLLAPFAEDREDVASLLNVATRLKHALKPVPVTPSFRAHLRDGLMMAAQHRASQRILIDRHDSAWSWVLGAAALGSAAGLIALAWRAKNQRQPVARVASESAGPN